MADLIWEEDAQEGSKAGYRGRLPAGSPILFLQAPTRYNRHWRLFGYLRWKDARAVDFDTAESAQTAAKAWVDDWMADLGVVPASVTSNSEAA